MIYLVFFSLVLIIAAGWQKNTALHQTDPLEEKKELEHEQMDVPVPVTMHYGMKMQDDLDLYIRADGILLCSQNLQYHIHRKDIVEVAVNASKKERSSLDAIKKIFYNQVEEHIHYIVIGYKNAANKLKVLTLRTESLTSHCLEKLHLLK